MEVDSSQIEWTAGSPVYGPASIHEGRQTVLLKILSDRRQEGGGIAYLARFLPPAGKVIKIVAVARSDEHIFALEGGRGTKSAQPARAADYTLNSEGQVHGAFIGTETLSLVIYRGEPDENISFEVVDAATTLL